MVYKEKTTYIAKFSDKHLAQISEHEALGLMSEDPNVLRVDVCSVQRISPRYTEYLVFNYSLERETRPGVIR